MEASRGVRWVGSRPSDFLAAAGGSDRNRCQTAARAIWFQLPPDAGEKEFSAACVTVDEAAAETSEVGCEPPTFFYEEFWCHNFTRISFSAAVCESEQVLFHA